jgi:hypothetical protein
MFTVQDEWEGRLKCYEPGYLPVSRWTMLSRNKANGLMVLLAGKLPVGLGAHFLL